MAIAIRPATAADVPEMGRIVYDAFYDIATKHGFPPDFPNVEFGVAVSGLFVQQEDVYSACAADGDTVRGSNHLEMWDEVATIGPISVDVTAQGEGIGRKLMLDAIEQARKQGFESVRLVQDSFNMQSLALYASVGFEVKEPLANLHLSGGGAAESGFRPATPDDFDGMDALCRKVYQVSRRNEIAAITGVGFPAFVLERGGRMAGYLLPGLIGHGVAEDNATLLAMFASAGAAQPNTSVLVPMRNAELYRAALAAGHRNVKVMNLMAYGPYAEPQGSYTPSVLY
jgi:ribosomal protein S18 acetylase RimI-like enzyme